MTVTAVDRTAVPKYPYEEYSRLAGEPITGDDIAMVRLVRRDKRRLNAALLAGLAILCEAVFLVWLLQKDHWPKGDTGWRQDLTFALIASVGLIEGMRLVNIITLAWATWNSHDPVPLQPLTKQRVAFVTTIVPGKESIEMVAATLEAATRIDYEGVLDVWLLDEGNNAQVKALCAGLGVHHFSRGGVEKYNRASGKHKARTKHGNYNAWLTEHGDDYDFWLSVDADHVPQPNFANRLLGYFRDPDVAFVVGPQVYGNYDNFVTKAAESQQYLFHGVLQRAGNRWFGPMFVGTNNAMRLSALRQVDGLADSITEDAATSLEIHAHRNPATGNRWKSVYTPDVLAIGSGPASWTDYFTQQQRWARGTDEAVLRKLHKHSFKLGVGRYVHYALLMSYYPFAAASWLLGTFNLLAYLFVGAGGVIVSAQLWLMLYCNAAALQIGVYLWNRRYNVSPHEEEGASGGLGMFVSVLSVPMYVSAMVAAIRNRNVSFAVTPKGSGRTLDTLRTFSRNILWCLLLVSGLIVSFPLGNDLPIMRAWAALNAVVMGLPVLLWLLAQHDAVSAARHDVRAPGRVRDLPDGVPVEARPPGLRAWDEVFVIDLRETDLAERGESR